MMRVVCAIVLLAVACGPAESDWMLGEFSDHAVEGIDARGVERWEIKDDGTATRSGLDMCGPDAHEWSGALAWHALDADTIELEPVESSDIDLFRIRRVDCSTATVTEITEGLPDHDHDIYRGRMCLEPNEVGPCPPDESCEGPWCRTVWCEPPPACDEAHGG